MLTGPAPSTLYQLRRNIVARAFATPLVGPSKTNIEFQEIHKEFQLIQFHIHQQNAHLSHIKKHIPCLPQPKLRGSSAKEPASVDLSNKQQHDLHILAFTFSFVQMKVLQTLILCLSYLVTRRIKDNQTYISVIDSLKLFCFLMAYNVVRWLTYLISQWAELGHLTKWIWI